MATEYNIVYDERTVADRSKGVKHQIVLSFNPRTLGIVVKSPANFFVDETPVGMFAYRLVLAESPTTQHLDTFEWSGTKKLFNDKAGKRALITRRLAFDAFMSLVAPSRTLDRYDRFYHVAEAYMDNDDKELHYYKTGHIRHLDKYISASIRNPFSITSGAAPTDIPMHALVGIYPGYPLPDAKYATGVVLPSLTPPTVFRSQNPATGALFPAFESAPLLKLSQSYDPALANVHVYAGSNGVLYFVSAYAIHAGEPLSFSAPNTQLAVDANDARAFKLVDAKTWETRHLLVMKPSSAGVADATFAADTQTNAKRLKLTLPDEPPPPVLAPAEKAVPVDVNMLRNELLPEKAKEPEVKKRVIIPTAMKNLGVPTLKEALEALNKEVDINLSYEYMAMDKAICKKKTVLGDINDERCMAVKRDIAEFGRRYKKYEVHAFNETMTLDTLLKGLTPDRGAELHIDRESCKSDVIMNRGGEATMAISSQVIAEHRFIAYYPAYVFNKADFAKIVARVASEEVGREVRATSIDFGRDYVISRYRHNGTLVKTAARACVVYNIERVADTDQRVNVVLAADDQNFEIMLFAAHKIDAGTPMFMRRSNAVMHFYNRRLDMVYSSADVKPFVAVNVRKSQFGGGGMEEKPKSEKLDLHIEFAAGHIPAIFNIESATLPQIYQDFMGEKKQGPLTLTEEEEKLRLATLRKTDLYNNFKHTYKATALLCVNHSNYITKTVGSKITHFPEDVLKIAEETEKKIDIRESIVSQQQLSLKEVVNAVTELYPNDPNAHYELEKPSYDYEFKINNVISLYSIAMAAKTAPIDLKTAEMAEIRKGNVTHAFVMSSLVRMGIYTMALSEPDPEPLIDYVKSDRYDQEAEAFVKRLVTEKNSLENHYFVYLLSMQEEALLLYEKAVEENNAVDMNKYRRHYELVAKVTQPIIEELRAETMDKVEQARQIVDLTGNIEDILHKTKAQCGQYSKVSACVKEEEQEKMEEEEEEEEEEAAEDKEKMDVVKAEETKEGDVSVEEWKKYMRAHELKLKKERKESAKTEKMKYEKIKKEALEKVKKAHRGEELEVAEEEEEMMQKEDEPEVENLRRVETMQGSSVFVPLLALRARTMEARVITKESEFIADDEDEDEEEEGEEYEEMGEGGAKKRVNVNDILAPAQELEDYEASDLDKEIIEFLQSGSRERERDRPQDVAPVPKEKKKTVDPEKEKARKEKEEKKFEKMIAKYM